MYLAVWVGMWASLVYALVRRALVSRARDRWVTSWKDQINPWNACLGMNGFMLLMVVAHRPRFWTAYVPIAGAAILLALAGRSVDRPYR